MGHNCLSFRWSSHGSCKYGYPKSVVATPHYDADRQRCFVERSAEGARVVEYSPFLLFAFRVHLNVELVSKDGMNRYLTKYQTKPIATVECTKHSNSANGELSTVEGATIFPSCSHCYEVFYLDTRRRACRRTTIMSPIHSHDSYPKWLLLTRRPRHECFACNTIWQVRIALHMI